MRVFLVSMALLLSLAGLAGAAPELMIYNGDTLIDRGGISMGEWGSGHVVESYDVHYIGPKVLRVLSQGYYQGGVLTLENPASFQAFVSDPNAYFEFLVKPGVVPRPSSATASRGGGGTAAQQTTGRVAFLLRSFRVILVTDKGQMIVDGWPLRRSTLIGGNWRRLSIPLSAFKSASSEPATLLTGLRFFANRADIFYIGQIRFVIDNSPIRVKVTAKPDRVDLGEKVTLEAEVDGGNAYTSVSWDFYEADGIQVDAQGPKVEWIYHIPGEHVVTCTVSDVLGTKETVTATTKVTAVAGGGS
ncbi:MAG: PKD domain-containing protein [Armatimonadetes bacterium]|nr:PKD domain-containing protein [Armatimonadota bacterium]NIM24151.1 PKD domain-containing protein [Armatimonadota bacterium]NIM68010.1 PKD domain-containing protein [Armatimonadota bacterium]NIM76505.1 PKD domain-containing protein [Armatimonadota bacterium]NIN06244.1 PKD domain-containing protein [Armatimonadota bacterium]